MDSTLYGKAARVLELARSSGLTVATVESCTGGLIAATLTGVPGASDVFAGGLVVYSNALKTSLAGVPRTVLESYGAVSSQCAVALAQGGSKATGADLVVSVTGIAGPGGGSPEKPVGTTFFGIHLSGRTFWMRQVFGTIREQNRKASVLTALDAMISAMEHSFPSGFEEVDT